MILIILGAAILTIAALASITKHVINSKVGIKLGELDGATPVDVSLITFDSPKRPNMPDIYLNTDIVLKNRKLPAKIMFQNGLIGEYRNNYVQVLRIRKNDTEEIIYKSPELKPGYKIEKDYLRRLQKGVYECTAEISFLNIKTYDIHNLARVKMRLIIRK